MILTEKDKNRILDCLYNNKVYLTFGCYIDYYKWSRMLGLEPRGEGIWKGWSRSGRGNERYLSLYKGYLYAGMGISLDDSAFRRYGYRQVRIKSQWIENQLIGTTSILVDKQQITHNIQVSACSI